jgi:glycerophosphoryl diester phosphodiesterase
VLLVGWAVVALALAAATTPRVERVGRSMAPAFSGSLGPLLLFIAGIALLWAGVGLVVAIVNASSLALVIVRLYLTIGEPRAPRVPLADSPDQPGRLIRMPRSVIAGAAAVAILAVIGVALLTFLRTRANQPVLVIAHRGASAAAPENSLAAFRLAVEEGADFVELDVQESADGEVLVIHDKDLMKVAGSPVTIWESEAAQVRAVDIGNRVGPQFAGERVPTLAEALAVCKGRSRVIVELKSYGHDQKLEERVAAIVEAAGMENDCIFMSLDHHMVWKMKLLRPSWRVGVLVAKALGDLTTLQADFLAVESKIASAAFVRRAHRADKDVYVWTVNDPAWMLNAMGHGVDGLITDVPDVACRVVARRAALSDAQRILVALLVRLGARTESLKAEEALRP